MNWYVLALFAHIVGVVILFITQALQWLITVRLRRASSVAQARDWSGLITGLSRLAPISGALILVAGGYMTAIAWSIATAWIDVSLGAMVIMMVLSMGVVTTRLKAIQRAAIATSSDTMPAELQARIDDPALWVATQMAIAVALGIVFMMTVKTHLAVSIAVVVVSLALGALIGGMTLRPRHGAPSPTPVVHASEANAS